MKSMSDTDELRKLTFETIHTSQLPGKVGQSTTWRSAVVIA